MAFSETERLTNLVAELRQVYRPHLTGTLERLDVLHLLDKVQALLAANMEKNRVEWRLTSSLAEAPALGVEDQLKQVFINLGQNAIEAMQPAGGVLIVSVALSEDGRQVGVSFEDTGAGLAAADMDRLFEPFYTTKTAGLGLGLSICNDIVKRHDGRIVAESRPGKGALFTVWLPSLAPRNA
jgi:signal transduction histidine kinase